MSNTHLPHLKRPSGESLSSLLNDGCLDVFRKPSTPDPFVNASFLTLGVDKDKRERFWISCVNSLQGATSFLIDEDGDYRVYEWSMDDRIPAIYSAALQDNDTLWVTGGAIGRFIRLQLSSGDWESYPWGAGRFVTSGIAFDPETEKLFCGAQTALLSFDTKARQTARIYGEDERPPDNHHFDHWRLPDGSYGFILETPGLSYLRWDPKEESVSWRRLTDDQHHPMIDNVRHLKYTEGARLYLPHMGWFDGLTQEITPHDRPPQQEASWFGKMDDFVLGTQWDLNTGSVRVVSWDVTSGATSTLFIAHDATPLNFALTKSGKVVLVDVYGCFRRHDASTGSLELTKHIGPSHEHRCNVIVPVDRGRITGCPFISQNFWIFDGNTEKGYCAGRAGGSFGQVDYGVRVHDKIYFAIYGGGQLTEYDPECPTGFPTNPRQVAATDQGQHGAGITTDGQIVWAAFKPKYGTLDGAMIRFDTTTGEATYRIGAVKSQHILNPIFDETSGQIVAGTSYLSDCQTAEPVHDTAFAVLVDPATMEILHRAPGPAGVETVECHGPIQGSQWLVQCGQELFTFDTGASSLTSFDSCAKLPDGTDRILYSGRAGRFLIQADNELHLWIALDGQLETLIEFEPDFVARWWVHGKDITFDCGEYAAVWRNWRG